jgi:hypothetical protein
MTAPVAARDREQVADRLLRASAEHSHDPLAEIDWDAPLVEGMFFLPERRISLYGTPLWERMSHDQRVELSRHEVASTAGIGIWFEVILMQMLSRYIYDRDLQQRHLQYGLIEIADECRHSIMFARLLEKLGCPTYRPDRLAHELGRIMKTTSSGPDMFAAALIAEEILDRLQREAMADETVQPLVRHVSRIHVVEEARHVRYAREALARVMPRLGPVRRELVRGSIAWSAHVISTRLVHPDAYRAVGLDAREAAQAARTSPARRETLAWAASRLTEFFTEVGLIGGPSRVVWRRSGLLAARPSAAPA